MRFSESGEGTRGPEGGAKGSCGTRALPPLSYHPWPMPAASWSATIVQLPANNHPRAAAACGSEEAQAHTCSQGW